MQLQRLLNSGTEPNLALVVELMVTTGLPQSLVSQVLAISLVNLEMLNLSGTSVLELPSSFAALQNLKQLFLPADTFSHPEVVLKTLTQLKGLKEVNDLAYPDQSFLRKLHAAMPPVRFGSQSHRPSIRYRVDL